MESSLRPILRFPATGVARAKAQAAEQWRQQQQQAYQYQGGGETLRLDPETQRIATEAARQARSVCAKFCCACLCLALIILFIVLAATGTLGGTPNPV